MVTGMMRFKEHFENFRDRYVLIGGSACSLLMDDAGVDFRTTKDFDIVLCVEALDAEFVKAFWEFVRLGGYETRQKSTGERLFYRFEKPKDTNYPHMLELFSKIPDALDYEGEGHLTPIPVGEEASSLSAILLDEIYYAFLHAGKRDLDGLSVVGTEWIIPLKARAWIDLTERKASGERVDSSDIKKHKNDVFRLYRIVSPANSFQLPGQVGEDLSRFIVAMETEPFDLKPLGYRNVKLSEVLAGLRNFYGLSD